MVKSLVPCTLNRTESFLTCTLARSHPFWRAKSQHPSTRFKSSLQCLPVWAVIVWRGVEVGVVTEACMPSPPLCVCSHPSNSISSLLALQSQREQRSWASTQFLVTAQTMNKALVTEEPQTQTRPLQVAPTVCGHNALGSRADYSDQYAPFPCSPTLFSAGDSMAQGHKHGFRW